MNKTSIKKFIFSSVLLCFVVNTYAQEQFTITGEFKDPKFEGSEIFIFLGKEKIKTYVKNGQFSLSGMVNELMYTYLNVNQDSLYERLHEDNDTSRLLLPGNVMFFLENGHIKMDGNNFNDVIISGTKNNDEYHKFKRNVSKQVEARNISSKEDMKNLQDSLSLVYIEQNPASTAIAPLLASLFSTYFISKNIDRLESLSNKITSEIGKRYYAALTSKIQRIKSFGVGSNAPLFTLKSDKGFDLSLSDYKGEYVLVEFWAHYCGPCISQVPYLKDAFHAYKDKGFNIVQISVDNAKDHNKWLKAIQRHTSDWDNVIDVEDFNNSVRHKYKVQGIPSNFLVDPEGKIVEVDLKGDNLINVLSKLLD